MRHVSLNNFGVIKTRSNLIDTKTSFDKIENQVRIVGKVRSFNITFETSLFKFSIPTFSFLSSTSKVFEIEFDGPDGNSFQNVE